MSLEKIAYYKSNKRCNKIKNCKTTATLNENGIICKMHEIYVDDPMNHAHLSNKALKTIRWILPKCVNSGGFELNWLWIVNTFAIHIDSKWSVF